MPICCITAFVLAGKQKPQALLARFRASFTRVQQAEVYMNASTLVLRAATFPLTSRPKTLLAMVGVVPGGVVFLPLPRDFSVRPSQPGWRRHEDRPHRAARFRRRQNAGEREQRLVTEFHRQALPRLSRRWRFRLDGICAGDQYAWTRC